VKNSSWHRAHSVASIALFIIPVFSGRAEQNDPANQRVPVACFKDFETVYGTRYRAVRILDDPGTGRRWLLVQQVARPEAPALLPQMPDNHSCSKLPLEGSEGRSPTTANQNPARRVIHPGDFVILSEYTPVSDALLEAIALQPAAIGQALTVRLKSGGHLLRAVATSPGHATVLAEGDEAHR
jgi:hypothetical protein